MDASTDRALVHDILERMGLPNESLEVERLTGGVSSDIWLVRGPTGTVVLKRPLQRLRVAAEWVASPDRGDSEAAWLRFVSGAAPGLCPRVLGFDAVEHAIALEYLEADTHPNWKTELLAGRVDVSFAGAVGASLGRIHAASTRAAGIAQEFDHPDLFESLRIEPYLLRTAQAVPEAGSALTDIAAALRATRTALVHGDVSPKNILQGTGPVFLDAECATWSDPAFDLAFCLTHLVLKQIHLPVHADSLRSASRALRESYLATVTWESAADLAERTARLTPALMLARVAGASPAEYLTPDQQDLIRQAALTSLLDRVQVEDVLADNQNQGAAP